MLTLRFAGVMHDARRSFPRHAHDCWELICYLEGEGTLTVGGLQIPFKPGTIVAQPPAIAHAEVAPGGYRCLFVGMEGPRAHVGVVPRCQDDAHGSFRSIGEMLVREIAQTHAGWEANAQALLQTLWRLIERWSGAGDDLVRQAETLLLQQLSDATLRIATIARRLGVHEEQLRRRFVAATGRSPRSYLSRLRIDAARQLLAHGSGVAETATACGFADPFHFSKQFHRAVGHAPSHQRRDEGLR